MQPASDRDPPISLVLSDVDGTLLTKSKQLTNRSIQAVQQLYAHGIKFAITSSRPPRGLAMLVEPLALKAPLGAFNGGLLVSPEFAVISEKLLSPLAVEEAISFFQAQAMEFWVYQSNNWFVSNASGAHVEHEASVVQYNPQTTNFAMAPRENVHKIVGINDDLQKMQIAQSKLQELLAENASVSCSQSYYLDITNPIANKGEVVSDLANFFGISAAAIATIGDMANDVFMFKRSGISIAMGNAKIDVQEHATYVTASNEEEGFAQAIEQYVLAQLIRS